MANTTYNRDDLLIAEFKEAFNEFDKVGGQYCNVTDFW